MKPALALSYGFPDGAMANLTSHPDAVGRITARDTYDLPALDLNAFGSLLVSMHIDQRFLASRAEQIAGFLHDGGTVIANGHLAYPFLPGITGFHPLENYGLGDLAVLRLIDHRDHYYPGSSGGASGEVLRGWALPARPRKVYSSLRFHVSRPRTFEAAVPWGERSSDRSSLPTSQA